MADKRLRLRRIKINPQGKHGIFSSISIINGVLGIGKVKVIVSAGRRHFIAPPSSPKDFVGQAGLLRLKGLMPFGLSFTRE
jgi:hypothetical protein